MCSSRLLVPKIRKRISPLLEKLDSMAREREGDDEADMHVLYTYVVKPCRGSCLVLTRLVCVSVCDDACFEARDEARRERDTARRQRMEAACPSLECA